MSHIVGRGLAPAADRDAECSVGRGLAPAADRDAEHPVGRGLAPAADRDAECPVGRGLAPAEKYDVALTKFGKIAEDQLRQLEKRFPLWQVDQYVIMPNHIHAILRIEDVTAGASPRPTLTDVVCAYKSLTTRACKQNGFADKVFQTSFYEHVIRNQEDYRQIAEYICENPARWQEDELFI